jgi:hypothetical protein
MIKPYVDRVPLEDITELRASLLINNTVIPLNDFLQDYIANILFAIAKSLGDTPSDVTISINSDGLRIFTNSGEISFMGDFAKQMIENTIKGMLSPLKGILWLQNIIITAKEGTSCLSIERLKE